MSSSVQRLEEAHKMLYEYFIEEDISVAEYTYSMFTDHLLDKYNIKFELHEFGNVLGQLTSGVIVGFKDKWLINVNSDIIYTRRNFTLCHELSHFIWDCSFGADSQIFNSALVGEYSDDEEVERLANNAAGVFMIPDICIKRSIDLNMTFSKMMEKYSISYAALRYRLIQFMIFHLKCPVDVALGTIDDFINKNDYRGMTMFFYEEPFYIGRKVEEQFECISTK